MQVGYVPLEDQVDHAFHKREQDSRTSEYAYDDWAVAQVAKKLGKDADYKELSARAYNYANVFDESKGWVCGRFADGSFTDEFGENDHLFYITEGSPKHYTFYVPHDVAGLMELMGGKEIFQEKLNQMVGFAESIVSFLMAQLRPEWFDHCLPCRPDVFLPTQCLPKPFQSMDQHIGYSFWTVYDCMKTVQCIKALSGRSFDLVS